MISLIAAACQPLWPISAGYFLKKLTKKSTRDNLTVE
ncbi:hypothetical protein SPLC1_S550440 [Arthrospira platensis C1]|nr:hypothetical protein SPLC1_S550440 [Arthrospira platensis C1]